MYVTLFMICINRIAGLIDMWLLSESDDLIVSAASTYGKIAYGILGKPPMYVNRHTECNLKQDWQPCFFQFTKHYCFKDHYITNGVLNQITKCHDT